MIYIIIYLIGCVVVCCTLLMLHLREEDLIVKNLPVLILNTIASWFSLICICTYLLCNYIYENIDGNKVLIKHKKK